VQSRALLGRLGEERKPCLQGSGGQGFLVVPAGPLDGGQDWLC